MLSTDYWVVRFDDGVDAVGLTKKVEEEAKLPTPKRFDNKKKQ